MNTMLQSLVTYHGRMDGVLDPSGLPCYHKKVSYLLIILDVWMEWFAVHPGPTTLPQ